MSALLIALLVWLGSGVVALAALLTIGRRQLPAVASVILKPEGDEAAPRPAVEEERKAA